MLTEQYTGNESIRISGIPDSVGDGETELSKAVMDIANEIDAPIKAEDDGRQWTSIWGHNCKNSYTFVTPVVIT